VTLFAIVLWGKILGLSGLLLAVPIDLVIWSMVDHLLIRPRGPDPTD
jgi:predicted PurR-regulated permease PerM